MTTAAAYIRKSNDQQHRTEDVKSVATQRDLVTAFAAARGWTLDETSVIGEHVRPKRDCSTTMSLLNGTAIRSTRWS